MKKETFNKMEKWFIISFIIIMMIAGAYIHYGYIIHREFELNKFCEFRGGEKYGTYTSASYSGDSKSPDSYEFGLVCIIDGEHKYYKLMIED